MFINNFLYFHIGICILVILFEMFWGQYIKFKNIKMKKSTRKYKEEIRKQLNNIKIYGEIDKKHSHILTKKLKKTNKLLIFEKACDELIKEDLENMKKYINNLEYVFCNLAIHYEKTKNKAEKAYFAYIISKYFERITSEYVLTVLISTLYKFIECKSIYCKINAMEAIYKIGKTEDILKAIAIINNKYYTYNSVVLANGLKSVKSNKRILAKELFKKFDEYNKNIQIAIIKFLSDYKYIDEELILEKLKNKNISVDVKCEIMRYFQKNKNEDAKQYLIKQLSKNEIIANDLNIKAIGTLGYYEDKDTKELLHKLMESKDNMIKESVHKSLEKRQKLQKEQLLEVV